MTTTKKTRHISRLFSSLPALGGSITVEWFGPSDWEEGDPLPVALVDTVRITHACGDTQRFEFQPGDSRVEMMLQAFDVGFYKGQYHERLATPVAQEVTK